MEVVNRRLSRVFQTEESRITEVCEGIVKSRNTNKEIYSQSRGSTVLLHRYGRGADMSVQWTAAIQEVLRTATCTY